MRPTEPTCAGADRQWPARARRSHTPGAPLRTDDRSHGRSVVLAHGRVPSHRPLKGRRSRRVHTPRMSATRPLAGPTMKRSAGAGGPAEAGTAATPRRRRAQSVMCSPAVVLRPGGYPRAGPMLSPLSPRMPAARSATTAYRAPRTMTASSPPLTAEVTRRWSKVARRPELATASARR